MTGLRTVCVGLRIGAIVAAVVAMVATVRGEDSRAARAAFADPPREYSTGPLWNWNDLLTEQQVVGTLRDLAGQKVKQVWVHPQPGLMTPYLSDDWFRLWKAAIEEAKRLDMNIWMYDENSYPSGFAGGYVPEAMPVSRGRGLAFAESKQPGAVGPEVIAIYRLDGPRAVDITADVRAGKAPAQGNYLRATMVRAPNTTWNAGHCYVDLLYPGVTQKFLDITLQPYLKRFGDEFGKHIPGVFTDEPTILSCGSWPWTDDLPTQFQKRWGYSLLEHLPSLARPLGDWRRVRHNYMQTLLDLLIDRWARPYHDYCQRLGIEMTGHYLEHEWPNCLHTPDFMAVQAWEHRPGIDILMNQYQELPHAQLGNIRIVKEIGSVANQMGRRRTLSETYAGSGHEIRFEEMKRQGDWQIVLGLNTLNECLSHISLRGVRKGNWPRALSYHNPWWEAYHVLAGYFTRLQAAMTHGRQVNAVLVLEPTTSAWMVQGDPAQVEPIGTDFQDLISRLEQAQVEYDLGSEDLIARWGTVDGAELVVGQRRYHTIVLPPRTENLNGRTVELLKRCLDAGATVLCCGPAPTRVDGRESTQPLATVTKKPGWKRMEVAESVALLVNELAARAGDEFTIRRAAADAGRLFHHRRQFDDGQLVLLVNTSIDQPSRGRVQAVGRGVERWRPESGRVEPYPFHQAANGVEAAFDLPPCGSLLLFVSKAARPSPQSAAGAAAGAAAKADEIRPAVPMSVRRIDDNVLVLNYLDLIAGGKTQPGVHCRAATNALFQRNGFTTNPWFEAVQFADEHIRRKFPPESRFEATYRFTVAQRVPQRLTLVLERPDLYKRITCNGTLLKATPGAWWLDRAFGRIDLGGSVRLGENAITIAAEPFTVLHELEPVYILGDFNLRAIDRGFTIVPPQPLEAKTESTTHATNPDGTMWLSGGIGFRPELPPVRKDDPQPWLVFDLGRPIDLSAVRIWNYNEPNWPRLGVKTLSIAVDDSPGSAASDEKPPRGLGKFEIIPAPGAPSAAADGVFPQTLRLDARGVRRLRFDILANHNGVTYPTRDASRYHAFVGLAEVQFVDAAGRVISGVTVPRVSGELEVPGLCSRRAVNLVNGSGLRSGGWNVQGMPFYCGGVAYRQQFDVPQPAGRYTIDLPDWFGSVAKVQVNGRATGYIAWQPWRLDVTDALRPGRNDIEVIVIGTLRNTLGPHHAGPPNGVVTPQMFNQAPPSGPPPGAAYDTIGYGLFAPFVLRNHR